MLDLAVVALFPKELSNKIDILRREISNQFGSKVALLWPPHLTLRQGFYVPEDKVDMLISHFETFLHHLEPISIKIDGFKFVDDCKLNKWITSPYVIALNVVLEDELNRFHKKLLRFTEFSTHNGSNYNPHITLAYNDLNKDLFLKIKSYLSNKNFSAQVNLTEVAIILNIGNSHKIYKKIKLVKS